MDSTDQPGSAFACLVPLAIPGRTAGDRALQEGGADEPAVAIQGMAIDGGRQRRARSCQGDRRGRDGNGAMPPVHGIEFDQHPVMHPRESPQQACARETARCDGRQHRPGFGGFDARIEHREADVSGVGKQPGRRRIGSGFR